MFVLYMDGPNRDWSILEKLRAHGYKFKLTQISEIASCGLYVVHWSLQTGVKATGWELDRFLKALWKLCDDFPARQDLYIYLNRSDKFSLKFCQRRFVKEESVACQAIKIWQFIVNVVNYYQSLSKLKDPKDKSYD